MSQTLLNWLKKVEPGVAEQWIQRMGEYDPARVVNLRNLVSGEFNSEEIESLLENVPWFKATGLKDIYVDADVLSEEINNQYFETLDVSDVNEGALPVDELGELTFVPVENRDWTFRQGFVIVGMDKPKKSKNSQ